MTYVFGGTLNLTQLINRLLKFYKTKLYVDKKTKLHFRSHPQLNPDAEIF